MAKRRNQYTFTSNRPTQLDSFDQCRFWLRLNELSTTAKSQSQKQAIDHLKSSVRKVADRANWISTRICRFMPQYTLHEERHFLNVLAIMDALVPDGVIARFGPLDCVFPILAAYTHDLGMALSEDEHDHLQDESTEKGKHFASYRTRFAEELRHLERWKKCRDELAGHRNAKSQQESASARKRIDSIEGHILASYLRDTHTEDDQVKRLRRWLDLIKKETGDDNVFRYGVGGKDFQRELVLIGISHGRGALWLRRQLIQGGPDDRFFQPVATGESANLAFSGLLLRLADVMDFDASRTPRILFKHFGIENNKSVLEWNKHLSIVGWRLDIDPDGKQQPDLLYSAECQHPVHEKAIREFKTWIDAELSAVRIEMDAQRRQLPAAAQPRYDLHLPSQTRLDIRAARDPLTDQPKYVYYDLQFRLDQDEIQQLLMGESLYGDPGVCIRELLQNALDALELRELRLKMKQKGEAREPVGGDWLRPGWVREPDGREEELRVTLDWGTDEATGQQWLCVTDNGVGMTEEIIKNYFTQIGKSFYRSPEFNQERTAMQAAGEVVSPISIFGIGILSCFMIADRLVVRACTGASGEALDVSISGPGSLFWIQPGTLKHQGTEIVIFLKSRFELKYEPKELMGRLKRKFSYSLNRRLFGAEIDEFSDDDGIDENDVRHLDPVLHAAGHAAWALYPIVLTDGIHPEVRLDERFREERVAAIVSEDVKTRAEQWNCPPDYVDSPSWSFWEWGDSAGSEATGSRIRLWFPRHSSVGEHEPLPVDSGSNLCTYPELASFVEPQLPDRGRTIVFVKGMYVEDPRLCNRLLPIAEGVGTIVWIDLRGAVAPRLNAARSRALFPTEANAWKIALTLLVERFRAALRFASDKANKTAWKNAIQCFTWSNGMEVQNDQTAKTEFDLLAALKSSWSSEPDRTALELASHRFLQEQSLSRQHIKVFSRREHAEKLRDERLTIDLQFGDSNLFDDADYCLHKHGFDVRHLLDNSRQLKRDPRLMSFAIILYQQLLRCPFNADVVGAFSGMRVAPDVCFQASALQEAFFPTLQASWAPLGLMHLRGCIGNATLSGPALISFGFDDTSTTVDFTDSNGDTPVELVQRGYDLTFPMTTVPLGQLRRECGEWRSDRWYRSLGVAPFLLPALHYVWSQHAEFLQKTFGVPHIYCLLPRFELWSKRFSDWTDADWHDPENLSALWDLSGHLTGTPGRVLWARGTHNINEIPKFGLPAPDFLEKHSSKDSSATHVRTKWR